MDKHKNMRLQVWKPGHVTGVLKHIHIPADRSSDSVRISLPAWTPFKTDAGPISRSLLRRPVYEFFSHYCCEWN